MLRALEEHLRGPDWVRRSARSNRVIVVSECGHVIKKVPSDPVLGELTALHTCSDEGRARILFRKSNYGVSAQLIQTAPYKAEYV